MLLLSTVVAVGWAYFNSPQIVLWLNPRNGITIEGVSYPDAVYRSQSLPVSVTLANYGPDSKDVKLEVISKDTQLQQNVWLSGLDSRTNITIWLPITSIGNQAFTVNAYWVGPGGFRTIKENSTDRIFVALGADYDTSATKFASRGEDFDWMLTVKNYGNTETNLTIQIIKKDPLIISSPDTQKIDNLQVGETRSANFHFIVPSTANLGDMTIQVKYLTTYPETQYYKDSTETFTSNYVVTIQESIIKTQIDNLG